MQRITFGSFCYTVEMQKEPEAIRLNQYLAQKGYASRRGADELIEKNKVRINGQIAEIGQKITKDDIVVVEGQTPLLEYTYLAYHKAKGIVTNSPEPDEEDILSTLNIDSGLNIQPVGRLDKDSSGLILLTNDTRIVEPLLSPKKAHEKEYRVEVNELIKRDFEKKIEKGVKLSDYITKPCTVKVHNRNTFSIVLTEGKNRQIRRMCAALGYSVKELSRVRILNIELGDLKKGAYREIDGQELEIFLEALGT